MIPHGTIEKLEHLIRLIDSRKDHQDEQVRHGVTYGSEYEIDLQLGFPPPAITDGEVTENALYQWIDQLCLTYEEELLDNDGMREEFQHTYGHWPDNVWLTPGLSMSMMFLKEQLNSWPYVRVVRDNSPAPADLPPAEEETEETDYSTRRFPWPEV